ncbi:MAG TPA: dynamin family protein [Anaerolineae bacterium]
MLTLLNDHQAALLRDEKKYLADLFAALTTLQAPSEDLANLSASLLQLDELFLIVVVGEFNSGKSALVNALLRQKILPEGVTPTTSRVTLVKYGEQIQEALGADDLTTFTFPLDLLRELNIVDTPGTNAVIREHEALTRKFVPRSDLVLFITSADRPFTESERQFLEHIREWGKKIVIAINKRDLLEDDAALTQVLHYVAGNAQNLLGLSPEIFPVSAKRAMAGDETGSGMDKLRAYIWSWLDESARLSVKFANPLGVADQILKHTESQQATENEQLANDVKTSATVEQEIGTFETETKMELEPRLAEIDNLLLRLQARGNDFFDQKFRLTNFPDLARGDRFRRLFENQVLAGVPAEIENRVSATVNWLVEKDLRHWQNVVSYLQRRRASSEQIVGDVANSFEMRRQQLLDSVTEAAQGVVASYDAEKESRELGNAVELSVALVAGVEVGAVGLGTAITMLVSSSMLDVTGILFAGIVAVVGLFIIPYQRSQAKNRFRDKIDTLRQNLNRVLTTQFNAEAERTLTRLRENVAPYVRFVKGEQERLQSVEQTLTDARKQLERLQDRLGLVFGK